MDSEILFGDSIIWIGLAYLDLYEILCLKSPIIYCGHYLKWLFILLGF